MDTLPTDRELTIVHQNVEGLKQHMSDLQRCNQLQPCDVLCVTETWSNTHEDFQLPGHTYLGRTRRECYSESNCVETVQLRTAKYGGVGMFLANTLLEDRQQEITQISSNLCSLEHMALSICDLQSGRRTIIIAIYRPQALPVDFACNQLAILLKNLPQSNRTILIGDMNEDANKQGTRQLQSFLKNFGFMQLIDQPTTIGANGATLDHIYVKSESTMPSGSGVIPTHFSYHEAVYVTY